MSIPRNINSVMTHLLMTVIVFFSMIAFATAQTTPNSPRTTTSPEQEKRSTQQPGTMKQQPGTMQQDQQGTQQGWQWFDDNATRDMDLNDDSRMQLREMDARYRKEYDAMGATPWTHADYQALTDRRNADIQRTLTPEQHKQWSSRRGTMGTSPTQDRGTAPTQDRGTSPTQNRGTTVPR